MLSPQPYCLEIIGDVATLALPAELPLMLVIARMTGHAVLRNLQAGRFCLCVAGMAVKPGMGAVKRIVALTVVVEYPALPSIRIVAAGAGTAQPTFMIIVARMAVGAFDGGVAIGCAYMAPLARHQHVQADQRKARDVMIEHNFTPPALR